MKKCASLIANAHIAIVKYLFIIKIVLSYANEILYKMNINKYK